MNKILIIGIGNGSRGDDALGWMLLERLEGKVSPEVTLHYAFQLSIEDALMLTDYETVVFIDASKNRYPEGYACRRLETPAAGNAAFTSHAQTPDNIMYLAHQLYDHCPVAWVLEISGEHWELGSPLSGRAAEHLESATVFFQKWLSDVDSFQLLSN